MPDRERAADVLRAAAPEGASFEVEEALYALTGESTALLAVLGPAARERPLPGRRGGPGKPPKCWAWRAALLVPALQAALSGAQGQARTAGSPDPDADTALAEALWRITGDAATPVAARAAALLGLEALGPAALGPEHIRRLTGLAERDLRVIRAGRETRIVHEDEALRHRMCSVLAEVPQPAAHG
ncbi:hypothetical protein [Streptomyces sp. NPDC090445]|uniref:hypothetical protein n=1 Tax=Streptomyces sp. NPDC090445 TaxID=3365963 RepID=UPI00381AA67A